MTYAIGPNESNYPKSSALKSKKNVEWIIIIFGIVLPAIAILSELKFRNCALSLFDPLPTHLHVLLVALIPLSNFLILLATRRDLKDHYAFLCLLNGMASGIALTYSLMFLPVLPLSLALILFFGFGLLGLAPLLAFMTTLGAGKVMEGLVHSTDTFFEPHHSQHLGHLLIIASIVAIELPSTLTRIHLHMAATPSTQAEGINWLRQYGNQEVMLRACYERSGKATDIIGSLYESGHPLPVEEARKLFYRVTGKPFNSVPIPASARATMAHGHVAENGALVTDEFDVDTDVAGENVSSVARGLSLSASNITGNISRTTAIADLTWTFTIANQSQLSREARGKILLPPGATVNNIRLLINGKELSGALKVRKAARAQYKQSVSSGNDPLLLSYCGVDELLIQCWPIKKDSAVEVTMQMLVPLVPESNHSGLLTLPYFDEHNFAITTPYKATISSLDEITGNGINVSKSIANNVSSTATAEFKKNTDVAHCQLKTLINLDNQSAQRLGVINSHTFLIGEVLKPATETALTNVIVVVDGSAAMKKYSTDIALAMQQLPNTINSQVIVVSDETERMPMIFNSGIPASVGIQALTSTKFAGGQDDNSALKTALNYCGNRTGWAVVWIHGAQPIQPEPNDKIDLRDSSTSPLLYDLQVEPGPNEELSGLLKLDRLRRVHSSGNCYADLSGLFKNLSKTDQPPTLAFSSVPYDMGADKSVAIDDVTTLWARQTIDHDAKLSDDEKSSLAQEYNIVTRISSALVHDPNPEVEYVHVTTAGSNRPISTQTIGTALDSLNPLSALKRSLENATTQLNSLSAGAPAGYSDSYKGTTSASPSMRFEFKQNSPAAAPQAGGLIGAAVDPAFGQRAAEQKPSENEKDAAKKESTIEESSDKSGLNSPALAGKSLRLEGFGKNRFQHQREVFIEPPSNEAAPVPEPDEWLLFGLTLMALGGAWFARFRVHAKRP